MVEDIIIKKSQEIDYGVMPLEGLWWCDNMTFNEGHAAQILHIGPFSEEGPTVLTLHSFITANGYQMEGKHHEIYLSDTRRGDTKNWKTILRQPIRI
jgi:hypothetical protein